MGIPSLGISSSNPSTSRKWKENQSIPALAWGQFAVPGRAPHLVKCPVVLKFFMMFEQGATCHKPWKIMYLVSPGTDCSLTIFICLLKGGEGWSC